MRTTAKSIILIMIGFSLLPLFAWERLYSDTNYQGVSSIIPAFDSGFIISGFSMPSRTSSFEDALLMKIDDDGDVVWSELHGGLIAREKSKGIVISEDYAYAIALSVDFPSFHGGLLKLDQSGDTLWCKEYHIGHQFTPFDVISTSDGGYALTGWIRYIHSDINSLLFLTIRTNSSGDTLWTRYYGNGDYNYAYAIRQTCDNGFLICGETRKTSSPYDEDIYIVKISEDGDSVWARTYDLSGSGYYDSAQSMFLMSGDTAIITGVADWATATGHSRLFIMCVDETGELLWHNIVGPADTYSGGIDIVRASGGGFIVLANSFSDISLSYYIWLLKFDEHGDTVWTRKFGEISDHSEYGANILATDDGGYIIAGHSVNLDSDNADPLVIRIDSLGNHVPSGISENPPFAKPAAFEISAYPNPFNSAVTIAAPASAEIEIFDVNGRMVAELIPPSPPLTRGEEEKSPLSKGDLRGFIWRPDASLGSGVYLVRVWAGDESITKRIVYLK